jgi:hypothetical protein
MVRYLIRTGHGNAVHCRTNRIALWYAHAGTVDTVP